MSYAYVKDNEIIEIHHFVPKNWKNVSNFNNLSDDELLLFGWQKIIDESIEYDELNYEIYNTEFQIKDGIVYRVSIIREKNITQDAIS